METNNETKYISGSDDTKETENKNIAAANGCEDHTITQDNKR